MALHLVGETIDKTRSHYRAETGKLIQLMRGIYVDADDDIETTVLRHAVRIAKYLYPKAYLSAASAAPAKNEAALDLIVAWHGVPLGHLIHDGFEWRWRPDEGEGPPLIRQTTPGRLPPFIVSLLPEGWLEQVLQDKDERAVLRSGKRYTSNITIVEQETELRQLPRD